MRVTTTEEIDRPSALYLSSVINGSLKESFVVFKKKKRKKKININIKWFGSLNGFSQS